MGVPRSSFKVIVIVAPVALVTDKLVGETEMVDKVGDTAPVKVTEAVLDKDTLSVVSVAKIVLVSAFVVLILAVT